MYSVNFDLFWLKYFIKIFNISGKIHAVIFAEYTHELMFIYTYNCKHIQLPSDLLINRVFTISMVYEIYSFHYNQSADHREIFYFDFDDQSSAYGDVFKRNCGYLKKRTCSEYNYCCCF